jgi:hypothetical protein
MRRHSRIIAWHLLALLLLTSNACFTPGPLKADRDPDDLFAPSEVNVIVVDAILIVDQTLPAVDLRRTAPPGENYFIQNTALEGAQLTISQGEATFNYSSDPTSPGRYLPPAGAPVVLPETTYELHVTTNSDPDVTATTLTPPRMRIAQLVLLDLDDDQEEIELRELRLFSEIGDEVYEIQQNQIEHTVGYLEARIEVSDNSASAVSYQFGISNLERASPLLFDSDFIDEGDIDDLEREETSPLLRLEDDGLFLSWKGINYAGRHKVKVFAVDRNWFDLVRTDNLGEERESGEAGQSFQRPLFHIENGIGLFASASVDSFGFFVRPEGIPPCSGCECWGCGDRNAWSGILDLESGNGRLRYDRDVGTGATCELSYEITAAQPTQACPTCAFAREFELGRLTVYRDRGACDEADGLQGERFRLAHGTNLVADTSGTPRFGLFIDADGFWAQIETGWSLVLTSAAEQRWLFGFSGG